MSQLGLTWVELPIQSSFTTSPPTHEPTTDVAPFGSDLHNTVDNSRRDIKTQKHGFSLLICLFNAHDFLLQGWSHWVRPFGHKCISTVTIQLASIVLGPSVLAHFSILLTYYRRACH